MVIHHSRHVGPTRTTWPFFSV